MLITLSLRAHFLFDGPSWARAHRLLLFNILQNSHLAQFRIALGYTGFLVHNLLAHRAFFARILFFIFATEGAPVTFLLGWRPILLRLGDGYAAVCFGLAVRLLRGL